MTALQLSYGERVVTGSRRAASPNAILNPTPGLPSEARADNSTGGTGMTSTGPGRTQPRHRNRLGLSGAAGHSPPKLDPAVAGKGTEPERAHVPCGGCSACCRAQMVFMTEGDDAALYDVGPAINPLTGEEGLALMQKPNGECVYLDQGRCSIYERAPLVCRTFDCRLAFLQLGDRAARRRALHISRDAVLQAGHDRLNTLTDTERRHADDVRRVLR